MWKTKRTVIMLALGMLLVLFSTAFAAAPTQASTSHCFCLYHLFSAAPSRVGWLGRGARQWIHGVWASNDLL
jgi:hypothetical protein